MIISDGFWQSIPPILLALGVLAKQFWDARVASADRLLAQQERVEAAEKLATISANVDGHLSTITKALAGEARLNVKLSVENDRLNEGSTTTPVTQTAEFDAELTRNPTDGTVALTERRAGVDDRRDDVE